MKKLILGLLLLIGLVALTSCNQGVKGDQYEKILKRGYIIVGLDDTFIPMGFRNNDNEIVGFDVDLAKAVFAEMNLEVKFQPIDWSMKETELYKGAIDVIWNGYTITEKRQEIVAFSTPYLENRQVMIVAKDSTISSKTDLSNKKVGVQSSSSGYDALIANKDVMNIINNKQPIEYPTYDFAFQDLINGRIDVLVIDEVFGEYYLKANNLTQFTILNDDFGTETYGVGFRKADVKLLETFNEAFETIKSNGTATEISLRWFNEDKILNK